jgi:hypothetical protein
MENPNLDLEKLYNLTSGDDSKKIPSKFKLAENKSRFTKIAFDLFRDSETEFVWRLEKDSETGEEYIIRTAQVISKPSSPHWTTEVDNQKTAITLVYKGCTIGQFKKAQLQYTEDNVDDWRKFIVEKISEDPTFLQKVLANISDERRRYIYNTYPELK